MKIFNDTIWNRTSDLPIRSAAPLPPCHRGLPIPTRQLQIHPGQLTAILTRQLKIQHVQRVTHQVTKYCVAYFPTQLALTL